LIGVSGAMSLAAGGPLCSSPASPEPGAHRHRDERAQASPLLARNSAKTRFARRPKSHLTTIGHHLRPCPLSDPRITAFRGPRVELCEVAAFETFAAVSPFLKVPRSSPRQAQSSTDAHSPS